MSKRWMLKGDCILHPSAQASVRVNNVELCYECWNRATTESREKIKKATDMYNRGLLTTNDLQNYLMDIAVSDSNIASSQEREQEPHHGYPSMLSDYSEFWRVTNDQST